MASPELSGNQSSNATLRTKNSRRYRARQNKPRQGGLTRCCCRVEHLIRSAYRILPAQFTMESIVVGIPATHPSANVKVSPSRQVTFKWTTGTYPARELRATP